MRHRSPRPVLPRLLLDIRRLRPLMAGFVRRSAALTRARLVVALAMVVGVAAGAVMTTSGLVEGAHRSDVPTASPGELRSSSDISGGGMSGGGMAGGGALPPASPESPLSPTSSARDEQTPDGTTSSRTPTDTSALAAGPQVPSGPTEVSRSASPGADQAASSSPTGQPTSPSAAPSNAASSSSSPTSTTSSPAPADESSPETSASTISADGDTWAVAFTASEPASFECSLDEGAFESCASTMLYTSLAPGPHTLSVRAIDLAGNIDQTPASLRRHPSGKKSTTP